MRKRHTKLTLIVLFCFAILTGLAAWTHNVPEKITDEDRTYIQQILHEAGYEITELQNPGTFEEEIYAIRAVQDSAFNTAPGTGMIAESSPREPKNLYQTDFAYCNDRSRYIDKALRFLGFETRYASLYSRKPDQIFVQRILSRGPPDGSHALVEVLTEKGWLIVDSRTKWISLTKEKNVIGLAELRSIRRQNTAEPDWDKNMEEMYKFLRKDFFVIYGLYSRHGRFYSPYTPFIPDINYPELLKNIP